MQVQLVQLVVQGVGTAERQHQNLGQNPFLGTGLFQTQQPRSQRRGGNLPGVTSLATFLLSRGAEERLRGLSTAANSLQLLWEDTVGLGNAPKRLFTLEPFAFGLA